LRLFLNLFRGGLKSPLAVDFKASKEYLSTTRNKTLRANKLNKPGPINKESRMDEEMINAMG